MKELTPRQKAFATAYVASGNARQAALQSGYSQSVADVATRDILGSVAVQEEILELRREAAERTAQLLAVAAERAAAVLAEIAEDPDAPTTARVRAAVALLDRAGFAAPIPIPPPDAGLADFLRDVAEGSA